MNTMYVLLVFTFDAVFSHLQMVYGCTVKNKKLVKTILNAYLPYFY